MGGDSAPREVVRGAVQAVQSLEDIEVLLVGQEDVVRGELDDCDWNGERIEIIPAENVIGMADSPVEALQKKRGSSIEVGTRLVREKRAGAFVSAGNTGACVAAASLFLRRLPVVKRPGIAVVFHTGEKPVVITDVGANVNCKPEHLIQYGVMASLYAREILDVEDPKVGLLNIGEEEEKGHAVAKQAHVLFQQTTLNYAGNVEGAEIFRGEIDVVVCDGFVGNIVLKVSEGLAERLLTLVAGAIQTGLNETPEARPAAPALQNVMEGLMRKIDYSEYGGAPLLGVNGNVIIAHGRSGAKAIANALGLARRVTMVDLKSKITECLTEVGAK